MKRTLLIIMSGFLISLLSVETSAADRYVGGSVSAGVATTFGGVRANSFSLMLSPEYGYCLGDKWMAGVRLSLGVAAGDGEKSVSYGNGIIETQATSTASLFTIGVNPYARYRCFGWNSLSIWAEGNLNLSDIFAAGGSANTFIAGISVKPVVTYDISPKVSLCSGLDLFSIGYSFFDVSGSTYSTAYLGIDSSLNLGGITIGLIYKL